MKKIYPECYLYLFWWIRILSCALLDKGKKLKLILDNGNTTMRFGIPKMQTVSLRSTVLGFCWGK